MKESIQTNLEKLADRFEELSALLSDAGVISDQNKFRDYSKEYAELEPVVQSYAAYQQAKDDVEEAQLMMEDSDPDMREMAKDEWSDAQAVHERLARLAIIEYFDGKGRLGL